MEDLILIGYGGHAKSVAESIRKGGKYRIIGYTDKEEHESIYPYLGTDQVLKDYYLKGCKNLAVCIGYLGKGTARENIYRTYKELGFHFPVIIDPSAIVADSAHIGEGTFIGQRVVVNTEAVIGKMCIINTLALIEHECFIGDYTHVAVGAVLCGQVKVGRAALIGANATVIQCRTIQDGTIVPAGETVR